MKSKFTKPLKKDSLKPGDVLVFQADIAELDYNKKSTLFIIKDCIEKENFIDQDTFLVYILEKNEYVLFHKGWFYGWHHFKWFETREYEVSYIEKL